MSTTKIIETGSLDFQSRDWGLLYAVKAVLKRTAMIPVRAGSPSGEFEVQLHQLVKSTSSDVDWDWRTGETRGVSVEYTAKIPWVYDFQTEDNFKKWVRRGQLDLQAQVSPRPEEWRFEDGDRLKITPKGGGTCLFEFFSLNSDTPYHVVEFGVFMSFEGMWIEELVRRHATALKQVAAAELPRELRRYGHLDPVEIAAVPREEVLKKLQELPDPYAQQRAEKKKQKELKKASKTPLVGAPEPLSALEKLKEKFR